MPIEKYKSWNKLGCQGEKEVNRFHILKYLELYNNKQWNQDISKFYCNTDSPLYSKPSQFLSATIGESISVDCKQYPPLSKAELNEWMNKLSKEIDCKK